MLFLYQYRTSDNVLKSGALRASDRDAAFATLKSQGIRPSRVEEAPGILNKFLGKGKRWTAIAVLGVVCLSLAGGVVRFRRQAIRAAQRPQEAQFAPRHQIYGDPTLMESFERGDFSEVFSDVGDRFLAQYAQPGRLMSQNDVGMTVDALRSAAGFSEEAYVAVLEVPVAIDPKDPRETRELKQIVNGMRLELHEYLQNGNGDLGTYALRLDERLGEERRIYERVRRELEGETSREVYAERNAELRRLGLKTIPTSKKNKAQDFLKTPIDSQTGKVL